MTQREIGERIRRYVRENFLYMRPEFEFADDENLLAHGIIDSLGAVELLGFVQDEFSITVEDEEVTERNLGSVRGIVEFVARKRAVAPVPDVAIANL